MSLTIRRTEAHHPEHGAVVKRGGADVAGGGIGAAVVVDWEAFARPITAASAPGRVWATFLTFSSTDTIARPFLSWPVTALGMRALAATAMEESIVGFIKTPPTSYPEQMEVTKKYVIDTMRESVGAVAPMLAIDHQKTRKDPNWLDRLQKEDTSRKQQTSKWLNYWKRGCTK